MKVTIRKIGNSEGIIIPKEVLTALNVKAGDQLDLVQEQGEMRLRRSADERFENQLEHAQRFMDRYRVALQKLAE